MDQPPSKSSEAAQLEHELLAELAPLQRDRPLHPLEDLPVICAAAHDWLQRRYPDAVVLPVVGNIVGTRATFPGLAELIAGLIG